MRIINLFRFPVLFFLALLLSAVAAVIVEIAFPAARSYRDPVAFSMVAILVLIWRRHLSHLWLFGSKLSAFSTAALLIFFAFIIFMNDETEGMQSAKDETQQTNTINGEAEAVKQAKLQAEAVARTEEARLAEQQENSAKEERLNNLLKTQTTMTEVRGALSIRRTEAQRIAAWNGLKGRYVKATGKVRDIDELWGDYVINVDLGWDEVSVECIPSRETKTSILNINKGSKISCNGILDDYTFIQILGEAHTNVRIKQE